MNAAQKVDAILNAWLDYITLDDYSNAKIEVNSDAIKQRGVSIVGDHVLIEQATFLELRQKKVIVTEGQKGEQEAVCCFPSEICSRGFLNVLTVQL